MLGNYIAMDTSHSILISFIHREKIEYIKVSYIIKEVCCVCYFFHTLHSYHSQVQTNLIMPTQQIQSLNKSDSAQSNYYQNKYTATATNQIFLAIDRPEGPH